MQKLYLFLVVILFSAGTYAQSISGTVSDSTNQQAIPGAVVYFPQLKLGSTSDMKGKYKISGIPKGTYQIQVEMLGYATISKQVIIKHDIQLDFVMGTSTSSTEEVVITALGNVTNAKRSPIPVTIVSHEALSQGTSTNVVDAIALQPGLSEITTGPGISKPEINGLGYNRVLTLMDGERQEDFQWGDEHGILIDPYAVYDAEIIRGAASLQYGANAMAGVVNFKSQPFPDQGTIRGSVTGEYQTNNGMIGTSVNAGGNKNGFVWDFRASHEESHCYWNPKDGYVWGTSSNQTNVRLVVGINKDWGYSRLTLSTLHNQIAIPDGNRDSATGKFEFDAPQGNAQYYKTGSLAGQLIPGTGQLYPDRSNFMSYRPAIAPYQLLDHNEAWWQNSINAGKGRIGADIGFSQSSRHEIDSGNVGVLNMSVNDIPYSFKYQVAGDNSGLKLTTGLNGMYEFMKNGAEPPSPYIGDFEIPDYSLFDVGGYAILNKDYKNLTVSGGLRYDFRTITGNPMYLAYYDSPNQIQVSPGTTGDGPVITHFNSFTKNYNGISGSLGASYQLPQNNYIKLNLARTFRAPAINELTSNQLDPANMYKLGNINLKPEEGYEADMAYGNSGKEFNFEIDGFYNYINNFIFADRIDSNALGAPIFKYQSNKAIITGVSAFLNIHPTIVKWLEIDNGFTYIYSFLPNQTDSTQHVPFTPAPRLTSELKVKLKNKSNSFLKGTFLSFGIAQYWVQNDIYSALYNELPSSSYALFNAGIGTGFVNRKTGRLICNLYCNVNNLFNIAYIDHTSREQYMWSYNGAYAGPTNYGGSAAVVTRPGQGIYDMGRNIGFKLIFPFENNKISHEEIPHSENN